MQVGKDMLASIQRYKIAIPRMVCYMHVILEPGCKSTTADNLTGGEKKNMHAP
jgi:hypothetical protein